MAHHTRREMKVLAKVKFTISQTTPRTASLGSRSGLMKSTMRKNHRRSIFAFKYELLSTPPLVRQDIYFTGNSSGGSARGRSPPAGAWGCPHFVSPPSFVAARRQETGS